MSFKFSLRDLLVLIALISVACAALANTGIWWHSIVVTATLTGMTGLVIWGTLNSGSRRAFAAGWLLFSAGYLALVFGPWTGQNLGANFLTTKLLAQMERNALGNHPSSPVMYSPGPLDANGDWNLVYSGLTSQSIWRSFQPSSGFVDLLGNNWVSACTTFQSTGHWLLASVFGYWGAHLAAFLYCFGRTAPQTNGSPS